MSTIGSLFEPRGIAVCGDFAFSGTFAYRVLANLIDGGYAGTVQPVSSGGEIVLGKTIIRSLESVSPEIDTVVIAGVPGKAVPVLLKGWRPRGAQRNVVWMGESPPSPDSGEQKRAADHDPLTQTIEILSAAGAVLIGPGSGGIINPSSSLRIWGTRISTLRPGNVAILGSGAGLLAAALEEVRKRGLGISRVIDVGQARGQSIETFAERLGSDEKTELVVLLPDRVADGRRFVGSLSALAMRKVVVALVAKGHYAGQRLGPALHCGAKLPDVTETAVRQCGALVVEDLATLGDAATVLAHSSHFLPTSDKALVVSTQDGLENLLLGRLRTGRVALAALTKRLADRMSKRATLSNGFVTLGPSIQQQELEEILVQLAREETVGGLIFVDTAGIVEPTSGTLASVRSTTGKPVMAYLQRSPLGDSGPSGSAVPLFGSPGSAAWAFGFLRDHGRLLEILRRKGIGSTPEPGRADTADIVTLSGECRFSGSRGEGRRAPRPKPARHAAGAPGLRDACICSEWAAAAFGRFSIRVAQRALVKDSQAAAVFARRTGFPIRIAQIEPGRGCCRPTEPQPSGPADLRSRHDILSAFMEIKTRRSSVLLLAEEGADFVLPATVCGWRDKVFGPVLSVTPRSGEIQARVCPFGKVDAESMVAPLLDLDTRPRTAGRAARLAELLTRLAQMFFQTQDMAGFEITELGVRHEEGMVFSGKTWRQDAHAIQKKTPARRPRRQRPAEKRTTRHH
ncbi:MAG: CoA-binding protein [Planctomycetota bacterium]|nr:CoA-binding protein [Planctomycetota bacterium]